jgi:hypothetical protein
MQSTKLDSWKGEIVDTHNCTRQWQLYKQDGTLFFSFLTGFNLFRNQGNKVFGTGHKVTYQN